MSSGKIIRTEKLDIVKTYPVEWTKYKVFVDLIQNFYDASGCEKFYEDVKFLYDSDNSTLQISSPVIFNYEWLKYVGVSSKRDASEANIGHFGEGFKIASLVATRDFNYTLYMESNDWKFKVDYLKDKLAGELVEFMAYKFMERGQEHSSVLTLEGVTDEDMNIVEKAKCSFFYEQNEDFKEVIFQDDNYAVYTSRGRDNGIFAHRLKRTYFGSDIKLYFCNNTFVDRDDTRERDDFSPSTATDCILEIVERMDSESALLLLEKLKCRRGTEKAKYERVYWHEVIKVLICQVSSNKRVVDKFAKKYGDKLLIGFPKSYDNYNRKKIAISWFRNSKYHGNRIVIEDFRTPGIVSDGTFWEALTAS